MIQPLNLLTPKEEMIMKRRSQPKAKSIKKTNYGDKVARGNMMYGPVKHKYGAFELSTGQIINIPLPIK